MPTGVRAQAAIDFLMSYGIALIIIAIALAAIYQIAVIKPALATATCTASPGFSCESFTVNKTGVLSLQLSQATGGSISVLGIACSSQVNSTGNKPAYGNIKVANTIAYYPPNNAPGLGVSIFSSSSASFLLYCYAGTGIASGILGNPYSGFVWLNYTIPSYGNVIQQVAVLNTRYT